MKKVCVKPLGFGTESNLLKKYKLHLIAFSSNSMETNFKDFLEI